MDSQAFVFIVILMTTARVVSTEMCNQIEANGKKECTFDRNWCGWRHAGWTFLYGSTDHKLFTSCGFSDECNYNFTNGLWRINRPTNYSNPYAYVDTKYDTGKTARLVTPEFPACPSDVCLEFSQRLNRYTGSLSVKLLNDESDPPDTWNLLGYSSWKTFHIDLLADKLRKPFKISFEGEFVRFGEHWRTHMNIDDVKTIPKSCPTDGDCSFEVRCFSWISDTGWTYASAGNVPRGGPSDDHTFANGKGRYKFIHGTKQREVFKSESLFPHRCLSFWFYCSTASCNLRVLQWHFTGWWTVWESPSAAYNFSNPQWTFAIVPLTVGDGLWIRFVGITGNTYAVVALDDIKFRNSTCIVDGDNIHGAVVKMSKTTAGFADLQSPLFCTASYLHFRLKIRYKINCQDGACLLEVLRSDNIGNMTLWNATTHSSDIQTHSLEVQPSGDTFSIIIRARKLRTPGWALEILVDSVSLEPGERIASTAPVTTSAPTHPAATDKNSSTGAPGGSPNQNEDNPSNGLVVGVSIGVVILVVVVLIVGVVWQRKRNSDNKKKRSESPSEILTPAVANAAYSPDSDPDSVHLSTNGVDSTYAKVNKPRKVNDVYSVPHKGPRAAASRVAANSDVYFDLEGDGTEADHYSAPDDADSSKRKGGNGYDLAAAKLSMAPNTTPRNFGLNKAKGTADSKPSRGPNPGSEREDEYNKLSLQTPRVASPAKPDTDNTYNHLDEHKHGVPVDQTGGNEYSLAKPDKAVSSKATGNPRRQEYVNVNPTTSLREDEYHNLDFDSGHAPNSAIRSTGTTGGQDEYNHLQADGPGFKVQGDDDHYNALDFDSHGQVQKGDDGMVYSHLDDDQSAV